MPEVIGGEVPYAVMAGQQMTYTEYSDINKRLNNGIDWLLPALAAVSLVLLLQMGVLFFLTPDDRRLFQLLLMTGVTAATICAGCTYRLRRRRLMEQLYDEMLCNEGNGTVTYLFSSRVEQVCGQDHTVLALDDDAMFWETEDHLVLQSNAHIIVWRGFDLTPQQADTVRLLVRDRLPSTNARQRGFLRCRLTQPLPVPPPPPPEPVLMQFSYVPDRVDMALAGWKQFFPFTVWVYVAGALACGMAVGAFSDGGLAAGLWVIPPVLILLPMVSLLQLPITAARLRKGEQKRVRYFGTPAIRLELTASGLLVTDELGREYHRAGTMRVKMTREITRVRTAQNQWQFPTAILPDAAQFLAVLSGGHNR